MSARDLIGGLAFLGAGGAAVFMAADLSVGRARLPGPGAMPIVIGIALIVLSIALTARAFVTRSARGEAEEQVAEPFGYARIVITVLAIAPTRRCSPGSASSPAPSCS